MGVRSGRLPQSLLWWDPISSFTRVEERDLQEVFEVGSWWVGWKSLSHFFELLVANHGGFEQEKTKEKCASLPG